MNIAYVTLAGLLLGQSSGPADAPNRFSFAAQPAATQGVTTADFQTPAAQNQQLQTGESQNTQAPGGQNAQGQAPINQDFKSIVKTSAESPAEQEPASRDSASREPAQLSEAAELLKNVLDSSGSRTISGRKYTLLEVLSRNVDRQQQRQLTHHYWKLSIATAEFKFAIDQLQQLETLRDNSVLGNSMLSRAKAAATAHAREAELKVLAAQAELAEQMYLPSSEQLPLTVDMPHVGSYHTYFDTLFAGRIPPAKARIIDQALPLRQESIEMRAAAVKHAQESVNAVQDALSQGQADVLMALETHRALQEQRHSFLDAVQQYNNDIADYAMTVAQIGTSDIVLVSMLVRSPAQPGPTPATRPAPNSLQNLQPSGSTTGSGSPNSSGASLPPGAFDDDWRAAPAGERELQPVERAAPQRSQPPAAFSPAPFGSTTPAAEPVREPAMISQPSAPQTPASSSEPEPETTEQPAAPQASGSNPFSDAPGSFTPATAPQAQPQTPPQAQPQTQPGSTPPSSNGPFGSNPFNQ